MTNAYDAANRIRNISGTFQSQPTTYLYGSCANGIPGSSGSDVCYASHGAPASYVYANGVARTYTINSRLQPMEIKDMRSPATLLDLQYVYGASAGRNNGNPSQIMVAKSTGIFTQSYAYDALNRLCAAVDAGAPVNIANCAAPTTGVNWAQNFGYDRYGNQWQASQAGLSGLTSQGQTPTSAGMIDTTTNRLTVSGIQYDGAGSANRPRWVRQR